MLHNSNVIICMALKYSFQDVEIFLKSLSIAGYKEELIIISDLDFENLAFEYRITSIKLAEIDNSFKGSLNKTFSRIVYNTFLRKLVLKLLFHLKFSLFSKIYNHFSHIYLNRFNLYINILKDVNYKNIFITDLRDVFFLKSPFSASSYIPLTFFGENDKLELRNEPYNSMWINTIYGSKGIKNIGNNIIYNMGTILGSKKEVEKFMRDILYESIKHKFFDANSSQDQGILNYLISTKKWPLSKKSKNAEIVFTVGTINEDEIKVDGNDIIYKNKKIDSSVVHQYDRKPNLIKYAQRFR